MNDLVTGVVMIVISIGAIVGIQRCTDNQRQEQAAKCLKEHGGKPYADTIVVPDKDNCAVKIMKLYNADCGFIKEVFVSTCPGKTNWTVPRTERVGKTTRTVHDEHETITE